MAALLSTFDYDILTNCRYQDNPAAGQLTNSVVPLREELAVVGCKHRADRALPLGKQQRRLVAEHNSARQLRAFGAPWMLASSQRYPGVASNEQRVSQRVNARA